MGKFCLDYESIQALDLSALPVRFVLGGRQGSLPTQLAVQAQAMGARFSHVRILTIERNACDFCIAFYLGEVLQAYPRKRTPQGLRA